MTLNKFVASTLVLLLSQPVLAMTVVEKDFVCPIGGEAFTQVIPASGTSFGKRTDLKPVGPISAPWTIPQCPTNKFVMFKDDFTDDELAKFKAIINTDEYKSIPDDSSEYYYMAKLLEGSDGRLEDIAWGYLQASWEMEGEGGRIAREQALANFINSLDAIDQTGEIDEGTKQDIINHNLMIGELNRLLGNFDEAKRHFETLKLDRKYTDESFVLDYIEQELRLIEAGNANPEMIGDTNKS